MVRERGRKQVMKRTRKDRWLDRSSFNTFFFLPLSLFSFSPYSVSFLWSSLPVLAKKLDITDAFQVETLIVSQGERARVTQGALFEEPSRSRRPKHEMRTRCHFHFVLHLLFKNNIEKWNEVKVISWGNIPYFNRKNRTWTTSTCVSLLEAVNNPARAMGTFQPLPSFPLHLWSSLILKPPGRIFYFRINIPSEVSCKVLKMTESDFILNLRKKMTFHPRFYYPKEFSPPKSTSLYPFLRGKKRWEEGNHNV